MGTEEGAHVRIAIETFGCTANHADSQLMKNLLEGAGHRVVDGEADLYVVNTCTVIRATERRVMRRLQELEHRGVPYIVAGCLPAAQPELLSELSPLAVLTPSTLQSIVDVVGVDYPVINSCLRSKQQGQEDHTPPSPPQSPHTIAIARGCTGSCSYCIVKRARGHLRSVPETEVVEKVKRAVHWGIKEIHLTAQDVGAYGLDTKSSLARLLRCVCSVEGEFFVRVGMMNPSTVLPQASELLEAFLHPKVFKFVHMPVQSGSDEVLSAMGRGYTVEQFEHLCTLFRERLGECTLCTDVIVGYPTESEEDFERTLDLIKRLEPDKLNITRFSARPHTPAFRLSQLPDWIKKERSRRLTRLYMVIAKKRQKRHVGNRMSVLVCERVKEGSVVARDAAYRNVVIRREYPIGAVLDVRVVRAHPMYLVAEPLDEAKDICSSVS